MTFPSPSFTSPLASKSWRTRHSLWLLAVYLGTGMLSGVGFLYCAIRVRTRKWWIRAAITCAIGAICLILIETLTTSVTNPDGTSTRVEDPGPGDDIAYGVLFTSWIAMIIYAHVVNREYLRWRASQDGTGAWYYEPLDGATQHTQQAAYPPPVPGTALSTAPPQGYSEASPYYGPPQLAVPTAGPVAPAPRTAPAPSAEQLDLNSADTATISLRSGIEPSCAQRIVAAREELGAFRSLDDVVRAVLLQPHELVRLQKVAVFHPQTGQTPLPGTPSAGPSHGSSTPPASGRVLDY